MTPRLRRARPWRSPLWLSLHEPRVITAIIVLFYALHAFVGFLGIIAVAHPHNTSGVAFRVVCAFALVTGTIGVPSAWSGRHWVERVATVLGMGTTLLAAVVALSFVVALPAGPKAYLSLLIALVTGGTLALWATRHARVTRLVWAFGKEPVAYQQRLAQAQLAALHTPTTKTG